MDISSSPFPPQGTSCRDRPASPAWKQQYVAPGDEYSAPQFSQQLAALPVPRVRQVVLFRRTTEPISGDDPEETMTCTQGIVVDLPPDEAPPPTFETTPAAQLQEPQERVPQLHYAPPPAAVWNPALVYAEPAVEDTPGGRGQPRDQGEPSGLCAQGLQRLETPPPPVPSDLKPSPGPSEPAPAPSPPPRERPVVEISARRSTMRIKSQSPRSPIPSESSVTDSDEFEPSTSTTDSDPASNPASDSEPDPQPPRKRPRYAPAPRAHTPATQTQSMPGRGLEMGPGRYARKTDWERRAFTALHGMIRCLFCPPEDGLKPRGTIHRLPDAATRHLRETCPRFEQSELYRRHRSKSKGGAPLTKAQIVGRVVREYEKVAVVQVFCRRDEGYRRRCAELGLSPANVEARLARHAILYKIEDCECCPHPLWSEYLAKAREGQQQQRKEKKGRKEKKKGGKGGGKDEAAVEREGGVKKEENEDVVIPVAFPKRRREFVKGRSQDTKGRTLKRSLSDVDEEESEVNLVLKGRLDVIVSE
ncbi:hypothetical protein DICSQDRAFT_180986 [Dichomitus squalens LYAD-421 SS1]|uniref:Uncharacterized protein n=1 Tax=Dichomitus squalens (strain LYAD-421) TaxID=732165 RepID=R7T1F6_DICSQ|nr:uncharacterized protein DICSQDRAFT_180986 [Dichomitus squalens LYAD-421 SS1]EJF61007.1 hypothetical protein DICSQDRAFT_180986 [Dichomitus squalens LYAD-421 SS1]